MLLIDDTFCGDPAPRWRRHGIGGGQVLTTDAGLRLQIGPASARSYANAQIDDYHGLPRAHFPWQPPLTLTVQARFSHPPGQLRGTAGFGLWNDPFGMTGSRPLSLPRALWFFFNSADAPLQLARDTAGYGWRAAQIDAWRLPFLTLAPLAPLAMPLMRWRWLYTRCWPLAQWALGIHENTLPIDITGWHTYQLHWGVNRTSFAVDDQIVLTSNTSPHGPLGLVLWIDNQGMVVLPWALPRHRLFLVNHEQWLDLGWVTITT